MPPRYSNSFDREKHVFHSPDFEELIKDAVRFFNGTPVHVLPPPEKFKGTGVYALYYIGKHRSYTPLYGANRLSFAYPIYVGKAVPRGWRQARNEASHDNSELYTRLTQHAHSIEQALDLSLEDFYCRFMILEGADSTLIGTVEAALIKLFLPVWNSCIDGFGNHDPGAGRYNQAKSDWDVLHPGRKWADKCVGETHSLKEVKKKVLSFWKDNMP